MNLVFSYVSLGSITRVHSAMLGVNAQLGLTPQPYLNLPVVNSRWMERLCLSQPIWLKPEQKGEYSCVGGVRLLGWLRQYASPRFSVPAFIVDGAVGPKFIGQQYLLEQLLVPALARTSPDRVRVIHESRESFKDWPLPVEISWSTLAIAHGFNSRGGRR